MEKTLEIDGKKIRFKSNGAVAKVYKSQFGGDLFSDMIQLTRMQEATDNMQDEEGNIDFEGLAHVDFDVLYNITWTLAKTADKNIPEPEEWLAEFDTFPVMDIFSELSEMIIESFTSQKQADKKK